MVYYLVKLDDRGIVAQLKTLLLDLETAPSLAYIWDPTDQYVPSERLIHESFILSWSAKWLSDKQVTSGWLSPDEAKQQDDSRIVEELAMLVRDADVLVAHNIDRFDLPMLNNRLLLLGLDPLGPKKTIDTYKMAKKNLRMPYNKLDYLGEVLGFGNKIKTSFSLWRDCYHGDASAILKMVKYNRRDVVLLEQVYKALLPYSNGMPRLYNPDWEDQHVCPHCGSEDVQRRGFYHTNASTFQQWKCNTCRKYFRSKKREPSQLTVAPL